MHAESSSPLTGRERQPMDAERDRAGAASSGRSGGERRRRGSAARDGGRGSARALRPPLQARSRETLDRLLGAAEKLLEARPFEQITIADLVREAESSVGSFYARFANKEALLPALYLRYDAALRETTERMLREREARPLTLEQHTREMIELTARRFTEQRWFLRAMALHARQSPDAIGPDVRAHRAAFHQRIVESFLRHRERIAHKDAAQAIRTAIFMVVAACRDKLLFGEAPHASTYETNVKQFVEDMTHAFVSYLITSPSPGMKKEKR